MTKTKPNSKKSKVCVSKILNLQKNFKKYLKLGQIKLAEIAFNDLKQIFKSAAQKGD